MPGSDYMDEKREYLRFDLDLPLEYGETNSPHARGALVVDSYELGLLFQPMKELPIGTKLNIAVLFPEIHELRNFEVLAEIDWKDVHRGENRKGYQFGLKFVGILQEDHQKLKQLLSEKDETI